MVDEVFEKRLIFPIQMSNSIRIMWRYGEKDQTTNSEPDLVIYA